MADIFLSYAKEDRESARTIAQVLESCGWSVFWDRKIIPGDNIRNGALSKDRQSPGYEASVKRWNDLVAKWNEIIGRYNANINEMNRLTEQIANEARRTV